LNNWNVVPKNFATDRYEARDRIEQRNGGRELAIDQSSLGRPANDVLYWKAPKEVLGDLVTLYDGNIEIHFINDGQQSQPTNRDEFILMRGNNIDLVHKIPQNQQFWPNTNVTYTVQCNEVRLERRRIPDSMRLSFHREHLLAKMARPSIVKVCSWPCPIWTHSL
jgi:hypothetical protein